MTPIRLRLVFVLTVLVGIPALGQYSIPWSKIAGGGGTSTNGPFSLRGTIGQHDASGTMTGQTYSVTGGFWALPGTVEGPGGPTLSVAPAGPGLATVFWTPNTPGWALLEAPEITGPWTNAPSGATNPATVPATFPRKFYRLYKP